MHAAAEAGVTTCASAAEALEGAEVVFTMLPKGEHSLAAYGGDEGIFATAAPGTANSPGRGPRPQPRPLFSP